MEKSQNMKDKKSFELGQNMKDEEWFEPYQNRKDEDAFEPPGQQIKNEESLGTGITDAIEMDIEMDTETDNDSNNDSTTRGRCCCLILLVWFVSFSVSLFISTSSEDSANWYFWTVMNVVLSLSPVALCIVGCCLAYWKEMKSGL